MHRFKIRVFHQHGKTLFRGWGFNKFYSTGTKNKYRNILKLSERGMFNNIFPDTSVNTIAALVDQAPQCVYAGFDPTANSLHVGNLLILMNLLHWQRGGHKVIIVLGGATGLIGDPSHRENERVALQQNILDNNINSIKKSILKIFENHRNHFWKDSKYPMQPIKIVNNIDWYKNINLIEFNKDIGQHFRIGTMLNKTSVQSRLESDTGMSYSEFSYQIFQAYDWLYLFKKYNCQFQIGGSDQLGNMSAGHELITRSLKKNVFGFTLPLLTAEGGKKFGKSLKNAVWLSAEKSSSFQLYQFFRRTKDADIENFLKLFTFLTLPAINEIMQHHQKNPEKNYAQTILAENITTLVHGDEALTEAKNTSELLYSSSIESLSKMNHEQIQAVFKDAHFVNLIPEAKMTIYDLAKKANCFKNEADATRIINAGGFYINYKKVNDVNEPVKFDVHILPNNITLLRTGKKTYHVVQWIELQKEEESVELTI